MLFPVVVGLVGHWNNAEYALPVISDTAKRRGSLIILTAIYVIRIADRHRGRYSYVEAVHWNCCKVSSAERASFKLNPYLGKLWNANAIVRLGMLEIPNRVERVMMIKCSE